MVGCIPSQLLGLYSLTSLVYFAKKRKKRKIETKQKQTKHDIIIYRKQ